MASGETELTFRNAMLLREIRGRPAQPVRAEDHAKHRSQQWVNAHRLEKYLGHSSSAAPSLQAGNVGAADYAESTEVGDETRYVTDARARSTRLGSLGRLG